MSTDNFNEVSRAIKHNKIKQSIIDDGVIIYELSAMSKLSPLEKEAMTFYMMGCLIEDVGKLIKTHETKNKINYIIYGAVCAIGAVGVGIGLHALIYGQFFWN